MRVCIYTAISGGYDDLKPQPEQTIPCDFVCFTDEPPRDVPEPWRVLPLPDARGSACLRAKRPKVLAHEAFAGVDAAPYDVTIWIDGSVQLIRSTFAATMVEAVRETGIAVVRHPHRDCIYDEVPATLGPKTGHKYVGMPLVEQVEHYRSEGYPEHHGLMIGGIIARTMGDPLVRAVDDAWWAEIERWSERDQLSLPYVLWKLGARYRVVDLDVWHNPLFEVRPHFDPVTDDLERRARSEFSSRPFRPTASGDALGAYDPETGLWRLDSGDGEPATFSFGPGGAGFVPLMGDWDGDGVRSPGLYDPATGTFFLKNAWGDGPADMTLGFGSPGALPVAGDWDGDGRDSIGIYVPEAGVWALKYTNEPGPADLNVNFGEPGADRIAVAGDWDGRGYDRVGLYAPAASTWFLLTELGDGAAVRTFDFGPNEGLPVVGDWDGDGADEVGVFLPKRGQAILADANHAMASSWRALVDPVGVVPVVAGWRGESTGEPSGSRDTGSDALHNYSADGVTERVLPEDLALAPEHLARYLFAAHRAPGRRVLDLCCGVGYGANLLAAAGARRVVGVDVDEGAIRFAREWYGSETVEFLCRDATADLPVTRFDVVVCFEGIEHVERPDLLIENMVTALAPGGTAFVSSPNGAHYEGGFSGNPHHVREYTRDEFESLLSGYFERVEIYAQWDDGQADADTPSRPVRYTPGAEGSDERPLVWVAVCRGARR